MPDKFAFIDTNIFLHYRSFDEVDWLDILKVKSAVLVIAPITLSELDEKKDESTTKLRQRAGSILKKLDTIWTKGSPFQVRLGVELLLQDVEPSIEYAAYQLDYRRQDDQLLAAVLQFRAENAGAQLILIAADFGLRVKAARRGIEATGLPEELKLPEEADPKEKRIQELERELLELKRVMPELKLTFSDKSERLEVLLAPPIIPSPDDIESLKKRVRLEYKKLGGETKTGIETLQLTNLRADPRGFSQRAIELYNTEMEHFYRSFDSWLSTSATHFNRKQWTVRLRFMLTNSGTAPAEDIDIFLHFPNGFELYNQQNLPKIPAEPKPPGKPSSGLAYIPLSLSGIELANKALRRLPDVGPRNVSIPQIRQTNGYEVKIHIEQLKHNLIENLGPLYIIFNSYEKACSFSIAYKMMSANIPKPASGKLHIIVRKSVDHQQGQK